MREQIYHLLNILANKVIHDRRVIRGDPRWSRVIREGGGISEDRGSGKKEKEGACCQGGGQGIAEVDGVVGKESFSFEEGAQQ